MERLTHIGTRGEVWISDNDKTRKNGRQQTAYKKLKEYEDLEEQGLLVRLPCKVGNTAFRINKGAKNPIIELTVTQIDITRRSYNLEVIDRDCGELMCFKNDIGKNVFLTREEAEKKLEEIQNDKA